MLLKTSLFSSKPPLGARVNLVHPLGRQCQMAVLFNEGRGLPGVQYYQTQSGRTPTLTSGSPVWVTNAHGTALYLGGMSLGLGSIAGRESHDIDYPDFPLTTVITRGQTVLIIRRRADPTLYGAGLFGLASGQPGFCHALCPYSDGNIYADYGGWGAPNRQVISGVTFTLLPERWIFTYGPRGTSVWRNGIRLFTQSSAVTRVLSDAQMFLNTAPSAASDYQEFNFAMFLATQWPDSLCQWWSAEPYAAFTRFTNKSYYFVGEASEPPPPTVAKTQMIII